jgi:hypothetical protein
VQEFVLQGGEDCGGMEGFIGHLVR